MSTVPDGGRVVGGHEPEGQQGQEDPGVPDEVGDEQEHVLGLGHVPVQTKNLKNPRVSN